MARMILADRAPGLHILGLTNAGGDSPIAYFQMRHFNRLVRFDGAVLDPVNIAQIGYAFRKSPFCGLSR